MPAPVLPTVQRFSELPTVAHRSSPAASSMRFAISRGWEINDTWLESSDTVVAFMRFARKRSSSGDVVLSLLEMAYQVGFDLQAAWVVFEAKRVSEIRPCTAYSARALAGSRSPAKSCTNASSLSWAKPPE